MFGGVYSGRKVLVTGHTGFKGAWLITWLLKLGAKVCGVSNEIPTNPSMFETLGLQKNIEHRICDITDEKKLRDIILAYKPEFVFHLAAQPIVSTAYAQPLATIKTNVIGTANVLDCLRELNSRCVAVVVTSDKCYENVEWVWGYKETDALGGKDIYSASKGAAEVIFHAYSESFFSDANSLVRTATGRAGNVIGGGDWAKDRIVADCMRCWSRGESVKIRNPTATRPWQHVLEPLSGYLLLGAKLLDDPLLKGQSYNFGPNSDVNVTVFDLLNSLSSHWDFDENSRFFQIENDTKFNEAGLLKLNCDKALSHLEWRSTLTYEECVKLVGDWYFKYYKTELDMLEFTNFQISKFEEIAQHKKMVWTN